MTIIQTRGAAVLLAAAALWGCESMDDPAPAAPADAAAAPAYTLLADIQPPPAKRTPAGALAMGETPVAEIEAFNADATVVSNPAEGCESHHYRAANGRVSAEVICGAERFAATGRWSILGSGLDCTVWDNDWVGGCVSWRHLGDGRVAFERTSGDVKPSSGESQVYEGNVFGL